MWDAYVFKKSLSLFNWSQNEKLKMIFFCIVILVKMYDYQYKYIHIIHTTMIMMMMVMIHTVFKLRWCIQYAIWNRVLVLSDDDDEICILKNVYNILCQKVCGWHGKLCKANELIKDLLVSKLIILMAQLLFCCFHYLTSNYLNQKPLRFVATLQ